MDATTPREVAKERMSKAFNEWLRRYLNNPEQFEREWQTVTRHLEEQRSGAPVTYGDICADFLISLMEDPMMVPAAAPPSLSQPAK